MKREQSAVIHAVKRERVNAVSAPGMQLLAHKVAAKKASVSSRVQQREGKSQFAFVPSEASIKIRRWPKL